MLSLNPISIALRVGPSALPSCGIGGLCPQNEVKLSRALMQFYEQEQTVK